MCFLSDNIYDYFNVSQGKVTVPSIDDSEEFTLADVSDSRIRNIVFPVTVWTTLAPTETEPRCMTTPNTNTNNRSF